MTNSNKIKLRKIKNEMQRTESLLSSNMRYFLISPSEEIGRKLAKSKKKLIRLDKQYMKLIKKH